MVGSEPERFFAPPSSATGTFSDWLGIFLDTSVEHKVGGLEIAAIVEGAYRFVAPKQLFAKLDDR